MAWRLSSERDSRDVAEGSELALDADAAGDDRAIGGSGVGVGSGGGVLFVITSSPRHRSPSPSTTFRQIGIAVKSIAII